MSVFSGGKDKDKDKNKDKSGYGFATIGPSTSGTGTENKGKKPFVYVDFIFDEGLLFVEIQNYSNCRPAFNVKVTFSPELKGVEGTKKISAMPLFTKIGFLAPRRIIRTFLDRSSSFFMRGEPSKYIVTISYTDRFNASYVTTINYDLSIFRDIGYVRMSSQSADEKSNYYEIATH